MEAVHGGSAWSWRQCMEAVHGGSAWRQCMEAVHGGSAWRVWPHETIENLLNKSPTQAIIIIFDVLLKVEGLYRADPGFEEGVVTFQFSCHLDLRSRVAS